MINKQSADQSIQYSLHTNTCLYHKPPFVSARINHFLPNSGHLSVKTSNINELLPRHKHVAKHQSNVIIYAMIKVSYQFTKKNEPIQTNPGTFQPFRSLILYRNINMYLYFVSCLHIERNLYCSKMYRVHRIFCPMCLQHVVIICTTVAINLPYISIALSTHSQLKWEIKPKSCPGTLNENIFEKRTFLAYQVPYFAPQ